MNLNIYMLNNNASDYGIIILKSIASTGELISSSICSALEWKSDLSAYQSVSQGETNINGETTLNIEIGTKLYKFSCTKAGITAFSVPQIVQTSGTILPIIYSTSIVTPSNLFNNFYLKFSI